MASPTTNTGNLSPSFLNFEPFSQADDLGAPPQGESLLSDLLEGDSQPQGSFLSEFLAHDFEPPSQEGIPLPQNPVLQAASQTGEPLPNVSQLQHVEAQPEAQARANKRPAETQSSSSQTPPQTKKARVDVEHLGPPAPLGSSTLEQLQASNFLHMQQLTWLQSNNTQLQLQLGHLQASHSRFYQMFIQFQASAEGKLLAQLQAENSSLRKQLAEMHEAKNQADLQRRIAITAVSNLFQANETSSAPSQ